MTDLNAHRRKVIYRCTHRGTKELDLLLGGFARLHVLEMDADTLADFERFTSLPEPELQEILTGKMPIPPEVSVQLREKLMSHKHAPSAR